MNKIDCHRHCSRYDYDRETIEVTAAEGEFERIVMFGHNGSHHGFDERILKWYNEYPKLIVPFACDFSYTEDDDQYAKQCLDKGFYGFGEILIGHSGEKHRSFENIEYDDSVPIRIFKSAGEAAAPVICHCDADYVEHFLRAVEQCKHTRFIWCHIGYDFSKGCSGRMRSAEEITSYLKKYDNLYFDTSFYLKDAKCMNEPGYIEMLEAYNDRFVFGLDATHDYGQWQKQYMPAYISVLSKLTNKTQENIYYNNFKKLIDERERFMDLHGALK